MISISMSASPNLCTRSFTLSPIQPLLGPSESMSRLVPRKARSSMASPVVQDAPQADGTEQGQDGDASPQERIRRLATKTIDLGKCITGRPYPLPSPTSKEPRRIASTSKKGKGKETSGEDPTEGDRLSY